MRNEYWSHGKVSDMSARRWLERVIASWELTKSDRRLSGPHHTLVTLLGLVILLAGCKITLEARTVVAPDGSVMRTTRYIADGEGQRKELAGYYHLPLGGTWDTQKVMQYNHWLKKDVEKTLHIYTATHQYAPGTTIPSDYLCA